MSKRADLKAQIHTLGEIKSILGAMKNLSIIEMNKVSRFLGAQNELAVSIEEALVDFERFYGRDVEGDTGEMIYVLLGSERGFCGGFNEAILKRFVAVVSSGKVPAKVIAVGRKLASKLGGEAGAVKVVQVIDGASAAEEIAGCIAELIRCLTRWPKMQWTLVHPENSDSHGKIAVVCPFTPKATAQARVESVAPLLNVSPKELHPQLFEQYLFSVLYRAFYLSFLAENRERLRHMDGALRTLERNWNQLRGQSNRLRQEEITEELEIIMLSAGG